MDTKVYHRGGRQYHYDEETDMTTVYEERDDIFVFIERFEGKPLMWPPPPPVSFLDEPKRPIWPIE